MTPLATGKPKTGVGAGEAFDGLPLAVVTDVVEGWPHPARRTMRAIPTPRARPRTMANDKAKRSPVTSPSRHRHNSMEDGRQQTGGMNSCGYSQWRRLK